MSHSPASATNPAPDSTAETTADSPERLYRRNFLYSMGNAIFYALGESLVDTRVVMTAFLSQLTNSNTLIALLAPMRMTGWFLPQFLAAPFIERYRVKMVFYRQNASIRLIAWIAMVIGIFFLHDPGLILGLFFLCIMFISLSDGLSGLPWMIVTSKTIPADKRGMLFATRNGIGTLMGILGSGIVVLVFANGGASSWLVYPRNYALLFALATLFFALSYWSYGQTVEPPDDNPVPKFDLRQQLARAVAIIRNENRYRRFLIGRLSISVGIAAIPFITVYAKRVLNINDGFLGAMVSVTIAANFFSNFVFGRISATKGNPINFVLAGIFGVLMCGVGLLIVLPLGISLPLVPVFFVLSGIANTAIQVSGGPMVMELAPPDDRSMWFGLTNTLIGLTMIATSAIGLIIDVFGYATMFSLCGVAFAFAILQILPMARKG
ncbi:MAG: hypothetical protein KIH69_016560 [Anaerolineae bacterium]|nr:hypothetical protein [Anaerolineae bacterium]